jgi:hypothetical protein
MSSAATNNGSDIDNGIKIKGIDALPVFVGGT